MGDVLAFSLVTCAFDFFEALFNTQDKSVMNRLLLQCPVFTFAQDKNFIFRFNRWTQLDLNSLMNRLPIVFLQQMLFNLFKIRLGRADNIPSSILAKLGKDHLLIVRSFLLVCLSHLRCSRLYPSPCDTILLMPNSSDLFHFSFC